MMNWNRQSKKNVKSLVKNKRNYMSLEPKLLMSLVQWILLINN